MSSSLILRNYDQFVHVATIASLDRSLKRSVVGSIRRLSAFFKSWKSCIYWREMSSPVILTSMFPFHSFSERILRETLQLFRSRNIYFVDAREMVSNISAKLTFGQNIPRTIDHQRGFNV